MSTGAWPPRNRATSSSGRTVAERPIRWAGFSRRASRRSRLTARWAPRLPPATACTSSTMTVSTPRRDSRACEVSIRNSDSGVVMRMSGGWLVSLRRSWAVVSPDRTPTRISGSLARCRTPVGGVADACQRRPQVALDVDPQRLERRDVEHPAALRLLRHRRREQLVERPQERRQRLAGPRRRHDQRVPPGPDRVPRPLLRRRGLRERRREPRPRGFAEALEACLHAFSLAHATDSGPVARISPVGRGNLNMTSARNRTPSSGERTTSTRQARPDGTSRGCGRP